MHHASSCRRRRSSHRSHVATENAVARAVAPAANAVSSIGSDRKISLAVTTHYDVLGVAADAKADTIKRAYYKRARAYHPDAHAGSTAELLDEAERAMSALNSAWTVLRDAQARRDYDQSLIAAAEAASPTVNGRRKSRGTRSTPPQEILSSGFTYW